MKYMIITSLFASISANAIFQNHLYIILFSTAGSILLYWLISSFLTIQHEVNFLREENRYFIDSFRNIRNPITLVHTPLKSVCSNVCPENIKEELSLAIRNIDCLEEHLTKLMGLKQLVIHSKNMDIAEHELGNFLKREINSQREYAAYKHVKLKIDIQFSYASVWIDQSKISPVIDRFVRNTIDHAKPGECVVLSIFISHEHWEIKTANSKDGKLMKCYRHKKPQLLKHKNELEYHFTKGVICQELIKLCNGKILVDNPTHTISLRFPIKCSGEKIASQADTTVNIAPNHEEKIVDSIFHETSAKRNSCKPVIILADSNDDFRTYLQARLSEDYIIKGFDNGEEALACIKEEYPDLVLCDTILHEMNGDELSSRLKTSGETSIIPVILYGSHIDIDQRNKRKFSLADTFIHAPFNIEDLKIEIAVLIKNNRLLRKSFLQKVFGKQFLQTSITEESNDKDDAFINHVKEFILENIDSEKLTIDEIATNLCMSRTAFFNKWKALTGEAPKFLIERIRMEKARELLESGKCPVYMVPEMIGLKNLKNFRHKYKEYFGITPSESIKKM